MLPCDGAQWQDPVDADTVALHDAEPGHLALGELVDGIGHLKTDSRFLYEYTRSVIRANFLTVLAFGTDIDHQGIQAGDELEWDLLDVFEVKTFYETMFLKMGLPITYLAFRLRRPVHLEDEPFAYPEDFDAAYWREAEGPRRSFSHQPTKGV